MKYRPEIDGLRALAVIPVILFHSGFEIFKGGFVGVDIFFVISGYLITTILIEEIENNRFSIINFYERRARRILPALYFIMLVCIPFAWIWMLPSQIKDFSLSLIAVSFFTSNFLFWRESGYFEALADEKPLLHTWSLAVEEQFYLFFPIFLIVLWRFGKNKVFWIIIFMTFISLVLSEWGWRNKPIANFYLPPTRVWELFSGAIIAFIIQKKGIQKNNFLALIGLFTIIFSIFAFDESTPFPSFYAVVPILGVLLIILFAEKSTITAKILSTKALVGIGLISYSAYLWHQPLFAFARIKLDEKPSEILMISLSILSLALAVISWRFIEKPFRRKDKKSFSSQLILVFSISGMIIFTVLGVLGYNNDKFKEIVGGDVGHKVYHKFIDENYNDCEPAQVAISALTWKGFLRCKQSGEDEFDWLLLGDSHAEHLFLGLAQENPNTNIAFYIFGAKPYLNEDKFKEIFEVISKIQDPKTIFLTMHFVTRVESEKSLIDGFGSTIRFLQGLGHRVILLGDIPRYDVSPEDCKYGKSIKQVTQKCSMNFSNFQQQTQIYESALRKLSSSFGVHFLSVHQPLCNNERCHMILNKNILYRDNHHLNIPGSILIGKMLSNQLSHILSNY